MSTMEAVCSSAAKDVLDLEGALVLVVTTTGEPAHLIAKYRPKVGVGVGVGEGGGGGGAAAG
jgi:pyruvate kinase